MLGFVVYHGEGSFSGHNGSQLQLPFSCQVRANCDSALFTATSSTCNPVTVTAPVLKFQTSTVCAPSLCLLRVQLQRRAPARSHLVHISFVLPPTLTDLIQLCLYLRSTQHIQPRVPQHHHLCFVTASTEYLYHSLSGHRTLTVNHSIPIYVPSPLSLSLLLNGHRTSAVNYFAPVRFPKYHYLSNSLCGHSKISVLHNPCQNLSAVSPLPSLTVWPRS